MDGFVIGPGGSWWGVGSVGAIALVTLVLLSMLVLGALVVLERVGASDVGA